MVKQRIGNAELVGGLIYVGAILYFSTHPLVHISLVGEDSGMWYNKFAGWLLTFFVGSLIGVAFNIRHRKDAFSLIGRTFNYITAAGSFAGLLLTLPVLYDFSPVIVQTVLLTALLSLISLRVPDESSVEFIIPVFAVFPLLARYGFGVFEPLVEQSSFWKWTELISAGVAPLGIYIINSQSEYVVGAGSRAKWIWLHSFHSILLGLVILAMNRGSESHLVVAATNHIGGTATMLGVDQGQMAATIITADPTDPDDATTLWIGGGFSTVSSIGMAIKSGLLTQMINGETVDSIGSAVLGMMFLCGLWTLFARNVPEDDRKLGAIAGMIWGYPVMAILGLSLL